MNIIDSEYNTLTVLDKNNKILIRNIDEYNILKYRDFDGKQIKVDLADGCKILETFNDGIFNISWKNIKLQSRDKIEIAKRIKYCIENQTSEPIKELLLNEVSTEIKDSVLNLFLVPFGDRLKISKTEIIIDDRFKVDMNGQAYYKNNNQYSSLCIVAGNNGNLTNKIIKHELGDVKIDFKTMEIYTKVLFLLFPNLQDRVFTNQLPDKLNKYISDKMKEDYD